ncbi:hypothetical protein KC345_g308 [Hortaea werneckii]|nr:hypothetical protein KC345_g308 [Hortaea werneckii]
MVRSRNSVLKSLSGYSLFDEPGSDSWKHTLKDLLVDKQSLDGVAGCRIVCLGVDRDIDSHLLVRIRVDFLTKSFEPLGMTRSMYWLNSSNGSIASRVVTSWIESLGTSDLSSAWEMTVEIALKDSVDSLPPLRIAALADLMASLPLESQTIVKLSNSMSLAFASKMLSRASANASWTASSAAFLADTGSVARMTRNGSTRGRVQARLPMQIPATPPNIQPLPSSSATTTRDKLIQHITQALSKALTDQHLTRHPQNHTAG